jgi:gas vesicle protein
MHKKHGKDFLVGAMLGSTLGALTALMFTTEKGHKIQGDLIKKYREFEKHVTGYAQNNKRKAKLALHKIAKNIDKKLQKAKVAILKKQKIKSALHKVAKVRRKVKRAKTKLHKKR